MWFCCCCFSYRLCCILFTFFSFFFFTFFTFYNKEKPQLKPFIWTLEFSLYILFILCKKFFFHLILLTPTHSPPVRLFIVIINAWQWISFLFISFFHFPLPLALHFLSFFYTFPKVLVGQGFCVHAFIDQSNCRQEALPLKSPQK